MRNNNISIHDATGPSWPGSSRSHSGTPHSVGLLWTTDHSDAETSTWQHTTLTRDSHRRLRRDSSSRSQ